MSELLLAQAYNNLWANYRIGAACRALSPEELDQARTGFFSSIISTLNHILIVDWFVVSALEGHSMGVAAFENRVPCPELDVYLAEQRKIDLQFIAACRSHAGSPDKAVTLNRGTFEQVERFDRTCLHLLQHQIHHRGQVHGMLSGTSVAPPQLDEFFCAWDADRNLRAPDFEVLGITEDEIWN